MTNQETINTIKENVKNQIKDLSHEEQINEIRNRRFYLAMQDDWNHEDYLWDEAYFELIEELCPQL